MGKVRSLPRVSRKSATMDPAGVCNSAGPSQDEIDGESSLDVVGFCMVLCSSPIEWCRRFGWLWLLFRPTLRERRRRRLLDEVRTGPRSSFGTSALMQTTWCLALAWAISRTALGIPGSGMMLVPSRRQFVRGRVSSCFGPLGGGCGERVMSLG